jgi:hypothetical protein
LTVDIRIYEIVKIMKYFLFLLLICVSSRYSLLGGEGNPGEKGSVVITESDIGAEPRKSDNENADNIGPAEKNNYTAPSETQVGFDITMMANSKDWYLGANALYSFGSIEAQLGLMFMFRPLKKSMFEKVDTYTYRQYQSRVFLFGLFAEKYFLVYGGHGIFARAGYGFTSAFYYGGENPPSERTPILSGGYVYRNQVLDIHAGYQYTQIPQNPDNYIFLSAGFRY